MGSTASSNKKSQYTAKFFIEKYGEQAILNTGKENIEKEIIMTKIPEMNQQQRRQIRQAKVDSIRKINDTESFIVNEMNERIKFLENQFPGRVSESEKHYDMSAQDIMGRSTILKEISELRKRTLQQFEKDEEHVEEKINKDIDRHLAKMEQKKKDRFEEYGQLTEEDRLRVRAQFRKKYKKKLAAYKSEFQKEFQSNPEIRRNKDSSNSVSASHPKKQIQDIRKKGQQLIVQGQKRIRGQSDKSDKSDKEIIFQGQSNEMPFTSGCFAC